MDPRHYYHITQNNDWGNRVKLKPRNWGYNRADNEPEDPRICVAPTILGCLVALGGCLDSSGIIYVYKTISKVKAVNPRSVIDAKVTGEKWLIRPTTFEKYGRIVKKKVPRELLDLEVGDESTLDDQRKFKRQLLKKRDWLIRY